MTHELLPMIQICLGFTLELLHQAMMTAFSIQQNNKLSSKLLQIQWDLPHSTATATEKDEQEDNDDVNNDMINPNHATNMNVPTPLILAHTFGVKEKIKWKICFFMIHDDFYAFEEDLQTSKENSFNTPPSSLK